MAHNFELVALYILIGCTWFALTRAPQHDD